MSENEAVRFALRRSIVWINQHLRRVQSEREGDKSIANLRDRASSISLKSQATMSSRPATVLTYDQFKAIITKLGMKDSEQSLHKSYAALIKLRKARHFSSTEIREKVSRSQENLKATRRPRQRTRQLRLPLTPQAWRRIV